MIEKVISGGQNGVDIAALRAAKKFGIPTGGWIPKGWITMSGPRPDYKTLYNMKEHKSPQYPGRTHANVKDSDGTMRFAVNWESPGEKCTLNAIRLYDKPRFDIDLTNFDQYFLKNAIEWLKDNNICILNVAGNTPKHFPKIEFRVEAMLSAMFEVLGYKKEDN